MKQRELQCALIKKATCMHSFGTSIGCGVKDRSRCICCLSKRVRLQIRLDVHRNSSYRRKCLAAPHPSYCNLHSAPAIRTKRYIFHVTCSRKNILKVRLITTSPCNHDKFSSEQRWARKIFWGAGTIFFFSSIQCLLTKKRPPFFQKNLIRSRVNFKNLPFWGAVTGGTLILLVFLHP
jgi:hypothetical protein